MTKAELIDAVAKSPDVKADAERTVGAFFEIVRTLPRRATRSLGRASARSAPKSRGPALAATHKPEQLVEVPGIDRDEVQRGHRSKPS